ncbi:hypothetical protein HY933_00540 [Candidatus Falkowbacteria bacterium]|nr:hypothetical protein [Candidatus Falkowbacteria bacterium]
MTEKIFIPAFISKMVGVFQVKVTEERSVVDDDNKITVNHVIGKVALIYEKLRNVVDYNDEHLLRKNAIFRILKRLLLIERRRETLGLQLLQELIRINYLPNNTLPESRAEEVDALLQKYLLVGEIIDRHYRSRPGSKFHTWFLEIAACEIEEALFDFRQRNALASAMVRVLKRDLALPDNINERDQDLLLHVAVLRSLFKSDEVIIYYYLLSEVYPEFFGGQPSAAVVEKLIQHWPRVRVRLDYYLYHPLRHKLNKIGRKYAVYFAILRDTLLEHPDEIDTLIRHPKMLADKLIETCDHRYREIRIKVIRSVIRSVLYLFITKMALALLIEVPVDYLLESAINYTTLVINILFPPVLMLLISLFIRLPKKQNTEKIIEEVKGIVYQRAGDEPKFHIRLHTASRGLVNFFFNLFYLITYGISFGLVIWFLIRLDFNILSGAIFIFFLSLVSFFALTIRGRARELIVLDSREGFINMIFDFFSLPIVRFGRWLSVKLSKVNVFVFMLDFVIEAPLKLILAVVERWFSFVREKKEEIY